MKKVFLSLLLLMPCVIQPIPGWMKKAAAITTGVVATAAIRDLVVLKPLRDERKKIRDYFKNAAQYLDAYDRDDLYAKYRCSITGPKARKYQELTRTMIDRSSILRCLGLRNLTHKILETKKDFPLPAFEYEQLLEATCKANAALKKMSEKQKEFETSVKIRPRFLHSLAPSTTPKWF